MPNTFSDKYGDIDCNKLLVTFPLSQCKYSLCLLLKHIVLQLEIIIYILLFFFVWIFSFFRKKSQVQTGEWWFKWKTETIFFNLGYFPTFTFIHFSSRFIYLKLVAFLPLSASLFKWYVVAKKQPLMARPLQAFQMTTTL